MKGAVALVLLAALQSVVGTDDDLAAQRTQSGNCPTPPSSSRTAAPSPKRSIGSGSP